MFCKRMMRFVLVGALSLVGATRTLQAKEESSDRTDPKDPTYIILTTSESTPEELFQRYPELATSWDEVARYNLLRSPGTAIEVPRDLFHPDRTLAKVAGVYGEAEVRRAFDDRYIPVVENLLLREGDVLRTWWHSGALIRFDNGSEVVLRGRSRARLIALPGLSEAPEARIKLQLVEGNIWTRTHGSERGFLIETPTANTMTRGTDFRLKIEAGQATRLEVLEGAVELEAAEGSILVPSQQGTLSSGTAPTLERLPETPQELLTPEPEQVFRASSFDEVFRWSPVPGAQAYRLEVSRDPDFFDLAEDRLTGARTEFRVEGLEPGTYFWRVSAVSPSGFEGLPAVGSYFVFVEKP